VRLRDFRQPALWLGIWVFGWALCITLSLVPAIGLPGPQGSDKIGHFLAYFTLTAWAVLTFRSRRAHLLAALALVGLGVAMEFAQAQLTTVRLGDVRDALANTLGVATGLALTFTPLARLLEWLDGRLFTRGARNS
jgi:VanZ family protein